MKFRDYLHLVETNTLEQWFKGSKVVDKQNKPLRMYHGTNNDFVNFLPNSHFGTARAANHIFGSKSWMTGKKADNARIIPVYLRITNPLKVSDQEASDEATLLNSIIRGNYPQLDIDYARKYGAFAAAQQVGYDGLVYKNNIEDRGKNSWVIFDNDQVKSAISEGKVQKIDWGYMQPVLIYTNPSLSQAKTLWKNIKNRKDLYIRGIMIEDNIVLAWDGYKMTHDDVRKQLYPDVKYYSSEFSTFEITNGRYNNCKIGNYSPFKNKDVQNLLSAGETALNESATITRMLKNPSATSLLGLLKRSPFKHLRGLIHDNDVYWWDAEEALHGHVAKELDHEDYIDDRLQLLMDEGHAILNFVDMSEQKFLSIPGLKRLVESPNIFLFQSGHGYIPGPEWLEINSSYYQ